MFQNVSITLAGVLCIYSKKSLTDGLCQVFQKIRNSQIIKDYLFI